MTEEWWIKELKNLNENDILNDRLIVELENFFLGESMMGMRCDAASYLRKLLLIGYWPFKELYNYINEQDISLHKLQNKLRDQENKISNFKFNAFIAQPFEESADDFFEKVAKPACYWEKVTPLRADKSPIENDLLIKVKKMMDKADLFIADLTGNNPSVFYEIGYLEKGNLQGIFLSSLGSKKNFYTKYNEIIKMDLGPEGVAQSRAKVRERLRTICCNIKNIGK